MAWDDFAERRYKPLPRRTGLISPAGNAVVDRLARAAYSESSSLSLDQCVSLVHLSHLLTLLLEDDAQVIPGDDGGEPYEVTIDDMGRIRKTIGFTSNENSRLLSLMEGGYFRHRAEALEAIPFITTRITEINRVIASDGCLYQLEVLGSGMGARRAVVKSFAGETISVEDRDIARKAARNLPYIGDWSLALPMRDLYQVVYENTAYVHMLYYRFGNWFIHDESWYASPEAYEEFLRRYIRSEMNDFEENMGLLVPQLEKIARKRADEREAKELARSKREAERTERTARRVEEEARKLARKESRAAARRVRENQRNPDYAADRVHTAEQGFLVTGNNGPVRLHYATCPSVAKQRQELDQGIRAKIRKYPALIDESEVRQLVTFRPCGICKPSISEL